LDPLEPYHGDTSMYFEVVGEIEAAETIAVGRQIHILAQLRRRYGAVRWRKRKGVAFVRVPGGRLRRAEVHSYEAHGIGRVRMKIKRFFD
jgi:hypothetical protein